MVCGDSVGDLVADSDLVSELNHAVIEITNTSVEIFLCCVEFHFTFLPASVGKALERTTMRISKYSEVIMKYFFLNQKTEHLEKKTH